ncbi:unnamed protein product [Hydatigera taeniaeformis]|uniref:Uncharacterized protein n=1 Tax=Hydatigena taeniaeformis TaxID=6205 RepID=A0A0R3WVQ0_HYDTA|nr:unnamed protein product [Hydatigera taeniaeformis]
MAMHLSLPSHQLPVLTESTDEIAEGNSLVHWNLPEESQTHFESTPTPREGTMCTDKAIGSTTYEPQYNALKAMDFDPFSTLPIVQSLMQSILQPPDVFTTEVFQDWLLLVTIEGLKFIKDIPENPASVMHMPHSHQNLCLGWFAFFCDYLPRAVEAHPSVKVCTFLARENHDFITSFRQRLNQCLKEVFNMEPHYEEVYREWCRFYHSL